MAVLKEELSRYFSRLGKLGAQKQAKEMSAEQRRARAKRAAQARWNSAKKAA
jgi:hypothetical protein